MASKTQRTRVLTGAMALPSPQDKLNEGDSLLLDNFRVDRNGALETRRGAVLEPGAPAGSGNYHSLTRVSNTRYSGIGTDLYFGPPVPTLLASGLDGNKIGFAHYQGHSWVMNRNKQLRLDFQQVHPWSPAPPASAPVATASAQSSVELNEFDSGSGITVLASTDGTTWADPGVTYDATIRKSGGASLKLPGGGAQTVVVQVVQAMNTQTGGGVQDEDKFLVWVYLSDPKALQSMVVRMIDSAGNLAECNLRQGSAWDVAGVLNQTAESWTELNIRRIVNVDAFQQAIGLATAAAQAGTGDFATVTDLEAQLSAILHQPAFQVIAGRDAQILSINNVPAQQATAFNWTAVTEIDITFVTSASCEIHLDRMRMTGSPLVSINGTVNYYVTFLDDQLYESNPSPPSNDLTVNNQPVHLANIPTAGTGTQVVRARRIYRIGGGLSQALMVDILWDNTTTDWDDPSSNDDAQNQGIQMPFDHDLAPAARGVMGPYYGKLLAWNTDKHPARVFWTNSAQPAFFPGADDDDIGNWEDAGGDDDQMLMITDHKIRAILYKERSIWLYPGDPEKTSPVRTNANIGLAGPNAVVNAGAIDYLVGSEGVYTFNGDFEHKISGAIDAIFKGDWTRLNSGESIPPLERSAIQTCTIGLRGDRLRVCYPEQGQSTPNVVLICHLIAPENLASLPSYKWSREKYNGLPSPAFTAMNDDGPGRYLMAGLPGGYLYSLDTEGYRLDNGAAFHAIWQSGFLDQGLPDNRKVYSDLEVTFHSGDVLPLSTLSVYAIFDTDLNFGTKVLLGTISSGLRTTKFLRILDAAGNVGRTAKNVSFRIESDIQAYAAIYAVYLHWYPEERVADSFDSGPTDFGIPERVKEIDYIEFFMTAAGQQVQRQLTSDLPGSIMTVRSTVDFAAPSGRGNYRQRLAAPIDGRNFRLQFFNDPFGTAFQVHQARVRMRPIGEYIDGTLSTPEYYESPEFSVAPGRVGELKDFLLDYDNGGAGGRLEVWSDMPGGALAIRRSMPIPAQATRGIYVFPFESAVDTTTDGLPAGQLFKVRLYPPPGGILRLHGRAQFRARVIGVYFAGANGEIWETQPLDLFGGMSIYREISIEAQTAGAMTLDFLTELPGQDMRIESSYTLNPATSTPGRLPVYFRLPGNSKGRLQKFRVRGSYETRIFSCKVLGRKLEVNGGGWEWRAAPLEPTLDAWRDLQMPVRSTPEEFAWIDLRVDPIE